MSEVRRIRAWCKALYEREPWHGPALLPLLDDVTAAEAAAHPIAGAHSIWELVLHLIYWRRQAIRGAAGELIDTDLSVPDNWPTPSSPTAEAWDETKADLAATQAELVAAIEAFDDSSLDDHVADGRYSFYTLFHGVMHHDIYHGGQIVLLKKALRGSRPGDH